MIDKVGLSKIEKLNTEFFKDFSFEKVVNLNSNMAPIDKITSLICNLEEIHLEPFFPGVLATMNYRIKFIYTSIEEEELHIVESFHKCYTTICIPEKIDGDSLKALLRANKIKPKVNIYEIYVDILNKKKFFLKVFVHLRLEYQKGLSLSLNIFNSNNKGNLYLSSLDFNLEQITFNNDTSIKNFFWDTDETTLYMIKEEFSKDNLYAYNKKLQSEQLLIDDFKKITSLKIFENSIYLLGETEFSKGIFQANKPLFEIEEFHFLDTEEILDFTLLSNRLFLLVKKETGTLLKIISENFLEDDKELFLQGNCFILCSNILAFIGTNTSLILFNLDTLSNLGTFDLRGFTILKSFLKLDETTFIICASHENLTDSLFLIQKGRLTPLLKRSISIVSITFDNTRNLIILGIKRGNSIEIISLDIKKKPSIATSLFKVNSTNIILKSI